MVSMILKYPVKTIYGDIIVDSGTKISPENIDSITPINTTDYDHIHFISYKTIKDDIIDIIKKEPYEKIFKPDECDRIIRIMDNIILPLPVIESIYYFKENDYYTFRHFLMVFSLTTLLSLELLHDKDELEKNIKAGSSHDIGKICLPESLLNKRSALTKTEKNDLKQHTLTGYILTQYYFNRKEPHISLAALNHHERNDGSGYPFHIKLDDHISDIIVVSDVFDALISSRPYRPTPYDTRSALDEITGLGVQNKVNMTVVKALVNFNRENKTHYSLCDLSMDKRGVAPVDNLYGKTD
jgi:HD-GYP domain-containing protein (c-di-GMP phosphodiesterase class II)